MNVNNINGTSDNNCNCENWLDHWKNFSNQSLPTHCPEKNCIQKPEVGAHIQIDNPADRCWYIVPLCNNHNRQTGSSLEIIDSITLVSANTAETCG